MTFQRLFWYGALATLVALSVALVAPSVLTRADLGFYDAALRTVRRNGPSGRVVIVGIDDRSLADQGQWPWSREVIARFVDSLRAGHPAAVALDLLLAEPDRRGPGGSERPGQEGLTPSDSALARSLSQAPAVMSYAFTFDQPEASWSSHCVLHPLPLALVESASHGPLLDRLFQPSGAVCSLPGLNRAAGASGFLNAGPDEDGVLRRLPLVIAVEGKAYPSLALAAVFRATGARDLALASEPDGHARLDLGGRSVPLDARATMWLPFLGPRNTFRHYRASEVLAGRVPADSLKGRVVFVGATALGLLDVVATPFDPAFPGIEAHATTAEALLEGRFVASPPWRRAWELLGTVAAGLGATLLLAWLGHLGGAVAAGAAVVLLWAFSLWLLAGPGVFLSPVFPTLAVALVLATVTVYRVRHEWTRAEMEKHRQRRTRDFAVQSLTSLTGTRDASTGRHVVRTQEYARLLIRRLAELPRFRAELTPERVAAIVQLAPLHDIGKVGVPDAVLRKPDRLTEEERAEMRKHPRLGYEAIAQAQHEAGLTDQGDLELFQVAKDLVYTHHESWDGTGYPRGLKGDAIPVAGRIMALVDAYDALVERRVYRNPMSHQEAVEAITAGRGTRFDPDVVDAFVALQGEFRRLADRLVGEGPAPWPE